MIIHDICSIKAAGAHGVVLGVLSPHGAVDEAVLRELVRLSAPCVPSCVFGPGHRLLPHVHVCI